MNENAVPNELLLKKYTELKDYLRSLESVAVAFSSGVATNREKSAKVIVVTKSL